MIRVSDGGATVTVGGELEGILAGLVQRTETASVRRIREAAEEVRAQADRKWYEHVRRETGRTGDIGTTETIDIGRGEIRVSVGSMDRRRAGGREIPLYVHEPGRTATIEVPVDRKRWMQSSESLRVPIVVVGGKPLYRVRVADPRAGTGRYLIPLLIRAPMKAKIKAIAAEIGQEISRGK